MSAHSWSGTQQDKPEGERASARSSWLLPLLIVALLTIPILSVEWTHTLRTVVLGGTVLGVVCGALGSFAVLRQQSLLGDALAQSFVRLGELTLVITATLSIIAFTLGAASTALMVNYAKRRGDKNIYTPPLLLEALLGRTI